MAYDFTLPVYPASPVSQTTTYLAGAGNGTNVTITGVLALSAAQSLTTGFSATSNGLVKYLLGYTLGGTALSGLSATSTGISLSVLKNDGVGIVYGYLLTSTLNPVISTATFLIDFNDPNYTNTKFNLSANKTSTVILTGTSNGSWIDNPLVALNGVNVGGQPTLAVYGGLTSINVNKFRTVGRQTRIVQGEY
ncbi:MAG: hypothetical protein EBU90_28870 [Proteobacteria bacterium]|nr:hypothetical protein [Pseudomonadota bacterium]